MVAMRKARGKYWNQRTKICERTAVTGRKLPVDATSTIGVDIAAASTNTSQESTSRREEGREKRSLVGCFRCEGAWFDFPCTIAGRLVGGGRELNANSVNQ